MVNPKRLLTPLPNQRKARDKLPPLSPSPTETYTNQYRHHLTSRNTNNIYLTNPSTSSSLVDTYYQSYGDSYEFGVSNNSFTRTTIDLSNSDSFRYASTTNYVYYTVQPGDTLHNLSVKYSCPVASIKRLNNIWSDQEFYGLAKIKLPAGRLRLISEVIDETTTKPEAEIQSVDKQTQWADTSSKERNSKNSNHLRYEPDFIRPIAGNRPSNLNYEGGRDSFFKNYDLNIERTRSAARCYDADAIMQSLARSGNIVDDDDSNDPNKIARREAQNLLNDMSDYGLSYNGLILFIFIVCLICPLAYVIYLEETHHDSNKTL